MEAKIFTMPDDGELFSSSIRERCTDLIQQGIWSGIEQNRLRRWLSNFNGRLEEYFAACILDALVYRSEDQTVAFLYQIFEKNLPNLTREHNTPFGPILDWLPLITNKNTDPGVRFVAVTSNDDPPGKSSDLIIRLMQRRLRVPRKYCIRPNIIENEIRRGSRVFVFVDDILGTGQQFDNVYREFDLDRILNGHYAVYTPLVAHEEGLSFVKKEHPNLHVSPVEYLAKDVGIFSENSLCFDDGVNNPDIAKKYYYEFLESRGITLEGAERRGYGGLDIAYVFSHSAPDNSIPLLWWDEDGWIPLFDR